MNPIGARPIHTGRLLLRAPQQSDALPLVEARSLAMKLPEAQRAVDAMAAEAGKPFVFHWVITLDGTPIGRIKAWEVDPYNGYCQLGYDVGPDYRGQGFMTEAVGAVLRYLLRDAGAHRVYCSVRECNTASRRVCEKNGMRHEGVLRQHYARQDGGYDDVHIYGILQNEMTEGEV